MARKRKEEENSTAGNNQSCTPLEKLRNTLLKECKGVHISVLAESDIATITTWLPTPAYDVNRIISGSLFKGIPEKKHIALVGAEACFKSSLMALIAAEAQKQEFMVVILDTEGAWTTDFVQRWGLDASKILYVYTPWTDDVPTVLAQIKEGDFEKMIIIVDSIGGLERRKLMNDAIKGDVKADQGSLQKEIKRILKLLVNICKAKKSIALTAGHYYGNPSGYGDPEQVGGGKYYKLSADIVLALKKNKIYDSEKNVIGNRINLVALKNRIYPPYNEATIEIDYIDGLNKYAGLLDIALEANIIKGGGAGWYTHVKSDKKFQGGYNFPVFAEENPEILNEIEEYIITTGYSTINETVKAAEELLEHTSLDNEETNITGEENDS